jgi:predicted phage-related endonuclease
MDQEERRKGIGGTDAAAVMGLSPWRDPVDVWMEKIGHPMWRPKPVTDAMRWGTILEPVIRTEYAKDTGIEVAPPPPRASFDDPEVMTWAPDKIRFSHPDAMAGDGIWEGKTSSRADEWADGVPVYYRVQVQQYLEIWQAPWADVSVLLPGGDFRTYREPADPPFQEKVRVAVLRFWEEHVIARVPPGKVDTTTLYPEADQELTIEGDSEAAKIVAQLVQIKGDIAFWKDAEEALREQLREKMGKAGHLVVPGYRVDYTNSRGAMTVGWEQVATALWNTLEMLRRYLVYDDKIVGTLSSEVVPHLDPTIYDTLIGLYSQAAAPTRPLTVRAIKEGKR